MNCHNSISVAALAALASSLVFAWTGAMAAERLFDMAASSTPVLVAAGAKASSRASARSSASSGATSGGKSGGCVVETETHAEVRRGDRHQVDRDHDRRVLKGEDCSVSSESSSRAEISSEKTEKPHK